MIAQKFASACELAHKMPGVVADFIEIDKQLKRRFREDSMTDVLLASFLELPHGQIRVDTPRESRTGADFDLFVVQQKNSSITHYRIQAKRLCDNNNWKQGRYHCLPHRVGRTGQLQADILCSTIPPGCIPLYAFYNHANVVKKSKGHAEGISLADGYAIQRCVHQVVAGDASYKRIGALLPLFFPLKTILCSPQKSRPLATPEESSRAAMKAIADRQDHWPLPLTPEQEELFADAEEERINRLAARENQRQERLAIPAAEVTPPEPSAEQVREEVLEAAESDGPAVRARSVRRPRVILVGPADKDASAATSVDPAAPGLADNGELSKRRSR